MPTAAERLHLLYEVNRRLTSLFDLEELLRFATRRARELFEAEGCALLLFDRERGELYFPIASQREAQWTTETRLKEIRFPADRGIAGWVLANAEATLVPDVSSDPRFFADVDRRTQLTTRAVLCAPLRGPEGPIGVVEVINPGKAFQAPEDLEFLEGLASDVAVAYEKVGLYERLRGEVLGLRQVCTVLGGGLALVGLLAGLGALLVHLAWALPVGEVFARPGVWIGLTALLVGLVLLGVGRGWLVERAPAARAPAAG